MCGRQLGAAVLPHPGQARHCHLVGVSLCPRSPASFWELVSRCCVTVWKGALACQEVLQELEHCPRVAWACWGLSGVVAQAPSLGKGH